ncbi:uncharacterized protein [Haliotis asinina]|uniref:uncharacterized protein n=1 Tax=Haliotis asinina TaxID=109174 RepID=UPI0035321AD3
MDRAFEGLEQTYPIVDDILIAGRTIAERDVRLRQSLQRARERIMLKPETTLPCQQEVKFFSEVLTTDGMKPDPEKVKAVHDMEVQTSKKESEGYLGQTDQKPLEVVFKKPLHAVPLRLQRMRMRLQIYDADVQFTPGKDVPVGDMLSNHFKDTPNNVDLSLDADIQSYVHMVVSNLPVTDKKLGEIAKATSGDEQLVAVKKCITFGWSEVIQDCTTFQEFWTSGMS